ncbi:MAG: transglycosylase SLT domain-containing protein [Armatimonadota bacterium]|nr:transglycosylase SLT domain-containing protein [Armatimonadota bacterium]
MRPVPSIVLLIVVIVGLVGGVGVAAPPAAPPTLVSAVEAFRRGDCAYHTAALRTLAEDPSPAGARAAVLLAGCLRAQRRYGEARTMFEVAASRHPTLAAFLRLQAAEAAAAAGDLEAALRDLAAPFDGASPAVLRRVAVLRGDALLRAGRPEEAADALRQVPGLDGSDDEIQSRVWWLRGVAAERTGNRREATEAYAMAWWAFPGSAGESAAGLRLRAVTGRSSPPIPALARVERARRLLKRGEPKAAEREWSLAVRDPLPDDIAAEAWYHLGLLRLGTPGAVNAFVRAARYPTRSEETQYYLGVAYHAVGRRADALAVWNRLADRRSPWASRAYLNLGRWAEAGRRWREADAWYLRAATNAPQAPSADEARWRRGWIRVRTGRTVEAERLFLEYGQAFPRTPRAPAHLYWAGRMRADRGADPRGLYRIVAERYPLTFYGQRARARLRMPPPPRPAAPPAPGLPDGEFTAPHLELAALGFSREAAEETEAHPAWETSAELRRLAAALWAAAEEPAKAAAAVEPLVASALLHTEEADPEVWPLAYPRPFWSDLLSQADHSGVDPYLVLAVMREESRFDPQAVSPARAVGLMQLLPTTAQGILGARLPPSRLTNPQLNIRAGVRYLAGLLRRYDGNVALAVAAYNAGPGGVRAVRHLAATDLDRFVESLPYAETRTYVRHVLQSYGIYRWLYP